MTSSTKIKLLLGIALTVMLCWIFFKELPSSKTWTSWTMPLSGQTIALDAGHGGPDGGAVSPSGLVEKDVALSVALYLRDFLQQAGALVVMTRESDRDLADEGTKRMSHRKKEDLVRRIAFIKDKGAGTLVSIHLNSFPQSKYYGAQTFYYANHPQNRLYAETMQNELRKQLENTTRVAKQTDKVFILKSATIPSILVEIGFLSNQQESQLLADHRYQRKLADAMYRGIIRFYGDGNMSKSK
jgi:N-acetylmuramoyl-L-alanine amidase